MAWNGLNGRHHPGPTNPFCPTLTCGDAPLPGAWRRRGNLRPLAFRTTCWCCTGALLAPCRCLENGRGGPVTSSIGVFLQLSVMLDLAAFTRLADRKSGRKPGGRSCARVAERQTRWLQVPVSERAWGFKSPLAHANKGTPVFGPGFLSFNRRLAGLRIRETSCSAVFPARRDESVLFQLFHASSEVRRLHAEDAA
jgi:hypothetical protein